MSWVKLDDQFFMNPKALAAGKDGRELYLAGLCYCASQLTDGWIAQAALPLVAATAGVKVSVARILEHVGLWEEGVGGWWVHDYLTYNPRASAVRDARAKKAAAGSKGGTTAAARRQAGAVADATDGATGSGSARGVPPIPFPYPHPLDTPLRSDGRNLWQTSGSG